MKAFQLSAVLCLIPLAFGETKVFRNFTLIDGTGKPASPGTVMVVVDGRIRSIQSAKGFTAPADAEGVDLTGKFVMPGIVNLHGHVGGTRDLEQDAKFYKRENIEQQLLAYASYGVTTVVSLGTDLDPIYQVREEQRASGRPNEARVYTAGRGFTDGYPAIAGFAYQVHSPIEAAAAITQAAAKKPDLVKIWVDDHFGRERTMPIDISAAIIAIARQRGLKVAAHIVNLDDAKQLTAAGVYGLAHSVRDRPVDQELIDSMRNHGTWQMAATLASQMAAFLYAQPQKFYTDPFFTRGVPNRVIDTLKSPDYRARLKSDPDFSKYAPMFEMAKQNLKRLFDGGVRIGMGSDSGAPGRFPGYFEHWEMELMTDAGLTPMQVIVASTKNGAEFLGANDLGTLENGRWADLIVLAKNPLDDIRNTRTIEAVYIAGSAIPHR